MQKHCNCLIFVPLELALIHQYHLSFVMFFPYGSLFCSGRSLRIIRGSELAWWLISRMWTLSLRVFININLSSVQIISLSSVHCLGRDRMISYLYSETCKIHETFIFTHNWDELVWYVYCTTVQLWCYDTVWPFSLKKIWVQLEYLTCVI